MPEGTALTGAGSQGGQANVGGQAGSEPGAGGGQSSTWRDSLPEEIRGEKSFDVFKGEKWEDVGPVMAKTYLESQKKFGNAIWLPKEDATPEEKQRFYNDIYAKLGRPEKPEDYKYNKPDFVSKDVEWDNGIEKEFLGIAHKIGLNSQQVQELVNWQGRLMEARVTSARKQVAETLKALENEWGPEYKGKLIKGERAVREIGGDELVNLLEKTGMGNNPILIKAFAEIGEILAEDGLIDGRIEGQSSAEDYEKRLQAMLNDKTHPLNDLSHPGHNQAVEEYRKLNRALVRAKK